MEYTLAYHKSKNENKKLVKLLQLYKFSNGKMTGWIS